MNAAAIVGIASLLRKPINLPGWRKVSVDWTHIDERHMPGGIYAAGRDVFLNMNKEGVLAAIRQAYGTAKTVTVQGERVLLEGVTKTGMTVQMWFDKSRKVVETAYPVVKK
jgi:hypothetical protein